jgi:hypothetical protein
VSVLARFLEDDLRGVHFALNVFNGTTALWLLLRYSAGVNPIWAIASMIAASEPIMGDALRMFRASLINTAVGCAVGLAAWPPVDRVNGPCRSPFRPPCSSPPTSCASPNMWRQAPITAAIVIASGLAQHSKLTGVEQGLSRVAEVFLGCLVGIIVCDCKRCAISSSRLLMRALWSTV